MHLGGGGGGGGRNTEYTDENSSTHQHQSKHHDATGGFENRAEFPQHTPFFSSFISNSLFVLLFSTNLPSPGSVVAFFPRT